MHIVQLKSLKILIYCSILISLFLVIYYIYISNYNKNILRQNERKINYLMMQQQRISNYIDGNGPNIQMKIQQKEILKTINELNAEDLVPEKYDEKVIKNRIIREKIKMMSENTFENVQNKLALDIFSMDEKHLIFNKTVSNIQIFYYLPIRWMYDEEHKRVLSVFHPSRGFYNYSTESAARQIIEEHFNEIRICGIGVVILHWDPNNTELNNFLPLVFRIANDMNQKYPESQLRIAIQIGFYYDRTVESVRNNIKFFVDNFTSNPSFFKIFSIKKQKSLPLFYINRAESVKHWEKLLTKNGLLTIRNTNYDSIVLAQLETNGSRLMIRTSNFDGFYTYNASNGANYYSTWKNWDKLRKFAETYNLLFVPTASPGYDTIEKFSPLRRFRSNGNYFEISFKTALLQNTELITLESYNNFHYGTQIESAKPHPNFRDYAPLHQLKYLRIAQHWVNQFYKYKIENQREQEKVSCENLLNNTIC